MREGQNALSAAYRAQATQFIASLSTSTADELVSLMWVVGATRMYMDKSAEISLLEPARLASDPMWCARTAAILDEFVKARDFEKANGLAVWLFTVRAASDAALADTGPAIWRELARAFPQFAVLAKRPGLDHNTKLMLAEMQKVPVGMDSEVKL